MPGHGQHTDRGAQPARVLETVTDRHKPVARAPDEDGRAADTIEVGTGVVREQCAARAPDVSVLRGALEEAEDRVRAERLGVGRPPKAEGQPAKPRPARERVPETC